MTQPLSLLPQSSGNKMEKSNYKEWSVDFNGKTIKVSNWWDWKMKGSADLYLGDEHLDKNTDMIANPKKVLLSKYEVSDEIKSIEVFAAGAFKIKISIMVNGDIVFADKLSLIDRFANIFFSKSYFGRTWGYMVLFGVLLRTITYL